MSCRSIFSQIQIESVIFFLQSQLIHACEQFFVVVLSLTSADDLTDTRHKTVHSSNGFSIFVQFHVERFDLLWIICYKYRTFEDFLSQVTLMLCLQITSPGYLIFKFIIIFLKQFDCFCISNVCKLGFHYMFQTVNQSFIDKIVEELHFFRCIFHDIADHIFQHGLCKDHVIFQIRECDLRLDHPEFCCMTCCVGVLCTESRSECINVAECLCKGFAIELSTYGQVGLFSEEILAEIYAALLCFRDVVQIHSCYLKHFARTFAVTSGDQRSMHINEISLLEEFVDRISGQGTYTEHCLERIGSRTQM